MVPLISPRSSSPASAPRLEFFQNGSNKAEHVTIDHSPFSIGRCETSDLRIDSAEVSREHAQIFRRGSIWAIRDLGSTNGTQVNGKPVRESFLSDGDILTIADTKVTFVAASVTSFQRMATQRIQPREPVKAPALVPSEIAHMRALTEATLWQAIPLRLASVVSLGGGDVEACFADQTKTMRQTDSEFNVSHAVGRRYQELARRRAVEMAQAQFTAHRIFLAADVAEFESPEHLLADVEQLRDGLPRDCELGVAISAPTIVDAAALADIARQVRQAGFLLGVVGFQGSSGQVLELAASGPNYLVLCDTMLKGLAPGSQPLRRLELVLTTCRQLGIKAVLPPCACQKTMAQCQYLGYQLAMQTPSPTDNADLGKVVALAS